MAITWKNLVAWTYDSRGRVTRESKVITGSGTFLTQWSYNPADLVASMIYPGDNSGGAGETVAFTYNQQMLLNTAIGSYTYVKGMTYDTTGRPDLIMMGLNGSDPYVKIDYIYPNWDAQSRTIAKKACFDCHSNERL